MTDRDGINSDQLLSRGLTTLCSVTRSATRKDVMSMLMIRCPRTGQEVWTGIETDPASHQKVPDVLFYTPCPQCGLDHASWCDEAWLAGNLLSRPELGDARVSGTTAKPLSLQLSEDQLSRNSQSFRDEAAQLLRAGRKARLENQRLLIFEIAATYKRLALEEGLRSGAQRSFSRTMRTPRGRNCSSTYSSWARAAARSQAR